MSSAGWIMLIGALVGGSCALLGCFLVLRKISMLGDAISHAILPGIVIAFLLTGSTSSFPIFVGAIVLGLLTAFLVQTLARSGVQGDAAIGVTFTSLFAIGVVLVSQYAAQKDLDLDCVLYGEIAFTPFDRVGGVPRAFWVNLALLAVNGIVLGLFYKQFKLCAFDPEMASAVGISVAGFHYLLMALVSITTVGAFESVGAILVVAMLIVPAATAYLLTDRLEWMLAIAVALGAAASAAGYFMARGLGCSIAGAMASVGGLFFATAFLFSPSHGVVTRRVAQGRMRRTVADEDMLLWAGRRLEIEAEPAFDLRTVSRGIERLPRDTGAIVSRMLRAGLLTEVEGHYRLTERGEGRALELIRRHRVYESYLDELGYPVDHLHAAADRVEHHLSPALTAAMDAAVAYPERDPQGKPIPGSQDPR